LTQLHSAKKFRTSTKSVNRLLIRFTRLLVKAEKGARRANRLFQYELDRTSSSQIFKVERKTTIKIRLAVSVVLFLAAIAVGGVAHDLTIDDLRPALIHRQDSRLAKSTRAFRPAT
jgi:hypothetical protein